MLKQFKGRSFITLLDYSSEEIDFIVNYVIDLKKQKQNRVFSHNLADRNFALIFDKPSCRTRSSFVTAAK